VAEPGSPGAHSGSQGTDESLPVVKKDPARVEGFRTARFGMDENEVFRAIFKDFTISKDQVTRQVHPTEKTTTLGITVKNLILQTGEAQILYILGHTTRKLIQINVVWGPRDGKSDAQALINAANLLGDYFSRKSYQEDGYLRNVGLKNGSILAFRGKDARGHMVMLFIEQLAAMEDKDKGKVSPEPKISLKLSYIEKPETPDVFHIREGDF